MSASFFRPECLEPPVVLKLRLQRFTLGHFLQLCELDSPYRPDAPRYEPGASEFMLAVFVCSQRKPVVGDVGKWWFPVFYRLWNLACRKLDPQAESKKFRDYVGAAISGPDVTPSSSSSTRRSSCPPAYCILRFLAEDLNQRIPDALETPMDQALNLWAAYVDKHVGVNTWDERREALWQYAQARKGVNGAG